MLLLLKTPGMWEGWDFAPFFWGGDLWEILFRRMPIKAEKNGPRSFAESAGLPFIKL